MPSNAILHPAQLPVVVVDLSHAVVQIVNQVRGRDFDLGHVPVEVHFLVLVHLQ